MIRSFWALTWVGLLAACPSKDIVLMDGDTGEPLNQVDVDLWLDSGVACAAAPCETGSYAFFTRTNHTGELVLPKVPAGFSVSAAVRGYRRLSLERGQGGRLRLTPDPTQAPPAGSTSKNLRLVQAVGGKPMLTLTLLNRDRLGLWVIPPNRAGLGPFTSFCDWTIEVKRADGQPWTPPAGAAPSCAAKPIDIKTGGMNNSHLSLAGWTPPPPRRHNGTLDRHTVTVAYAPDLDDGILMAQKVEATLRLPDQDGPIPADAAQLPNFGP